MPERIVGHCGRMTQTTVTAELPDLADHEGGLPSSTVGSPAVGRLLPRDSRSGRLLDLRAWAHHRQHFGPMPAVAAGLEPRALIDELEAAGLRGRGGGWFPVARKWRAVADQAQSRRGALRRVPVEVIANAMEGEPVSLKDATLLACVPHLVLDGLVAAAQALGAQRAHIAVHRGSASEAVVREAIRERAGRDGMPIIVLTPPARYVSSEESALAHFAGSGQATPVYPDRPFERGMKGRPTLVQNAETLANVALIARFGSAWFRQVGDPGAPGTTLVTVGGAVGAPGVVEVPTGIAVPDLLSRVGGLTGPVEAFLTGGYGGAWIDADTLLATSWQVDDVRAAGGVVGAGILWALDPAGCPLVELQRVMAYMAGESAGQCGPCRFGLPALAEDVAALADRRAVDFPRLDERLTLVVNRGGCKHPDGVARFAHTGLSVFADEIARHSAGACRAPDSPGTLPVPEPRQSPVAARSRDFS